MSFLCAAENSENSPPDPTASENGGSSGSGGGIFAWASQVLAGTEVDIVNILDSEMPVFVASGDDSVQDDTELDRTPPPGYAALQDDEEDHAHEEAEQVHDAVSEDVAAGEAEMEGSHEENLSEDELYRREVQAAALRLAEAAEAEGE